MQNMAPKLMAITPTQVAAENWRAGAMNAAVAFHGICSIRERRARKLKGPSERFADAAVGGATMTVNSAAQSPDVRNG